MKTSTFCRLAVAGLALLCGTVAQATTLQLPTPNVMSAGTYNQFQVYSLDLLTQCASAGDPRCLPSGPYPVQSSPGQIADQAIVLSGSNGMSNFTSPFPTGSQVDDVFDTPNGSTSTSFTMVDPGGQFTGDQTNRWDISLSLLQGYLQTHNLVFLFDNNQQGQQLSDWLYIWGQARIVDAAGNTINNLCFELSTGLGCDTSSDPSPASSAYVPVASNFCVDKITGLAYNLGTASNAGDCPSDGTHLNGGYYISNNLGTNVAEFAAFNQALNDAAKDGANSGYYLSINMKYFGNNGGYEQLWLCSQCDVSPPQRVPEPGSLALLGVALLGLCYTVSRRQRGHIRH